MAAWLEGCEPSGLLALSSTEMSAYAELPQAFVCYPDQRGERSRPSAYFD